MKFCNQRILIPKIIIAKISIFTNSKDKLKYFDFQQSTGVRIQITYQKMQGFIDKISEGKGKLLLGLGGAALLGVVSYLYHQYNEQSQEQIVEQRQSQPKTDLTNFDLQKQLDKFKQKLNINNPTLEQVKRMLAFSFQLTQKQLQRIANQFKKGRRAINRKQNMNEYFKTVAVGMIRMRQISSSLQQAVMIDIGVSPQILAAYQNELGPFLYEQQMNQALGNKQITLGEAKSAIKVQLDFIKAHGNQLVDKIIEHCKDWQIQAKQYIPQVFTIFLADQIDLVHPQMQQYDMKGVQKRFGKYLTEETKRMKEQMQPMILRMCVQLSLYKESDLTDLEINEELQQMEQIVVNQRREEKQMYKNVAQINEEDLNAHESANNSRQ